MSMEIIREEPSPAITEGGRGYVGQTAVCRAPCNNSSEEIHLIHLLSKSWADPVGVTSRHNFSI